MVLLGEGDAQATASGGDGRACGTVKRVPYLHVQGARRAPFIFKFQAVAPLGAAL